MTQREEFYWDLLVEGGIATSDELDLVKYIVSGTWEDIMDDVLYVRTGYRSLEQYCESEGIDCEY